MTLSPNFLKDYTFFASLSDRPSYDESKNLIFNVIFVSMGLFKIAGFILIQQTI
jgi:hypothetical protein